MPSLRNTIRAVSIAVLGNLAGHAAAVGFETTDDLKALVIRGDAALDSARAHSGASSLRLAPGSRVAWSLRASDGTGTIEMWVYEDGAKPSKPKTAGTGALWGLVQGDGRELMVGAIYAAYLSGDTTYAVGSSRPEQNEKPWQNVQYLGNVALRKTGWHKWTFVFDAVTGLKLLVDDKDVNVNPARPAFIWNKTRLDGFTGIVLAGDTTDAGQVLWVDDVTVTLGPDCKIKTKWPPSPPPPPADLTVLPQQAPWNPTPFAKWKNGPGAGEDYFPIAVWLQDPKLAKRYKAAGINLYMALHGGPTREQVDQLRDADMPFICDMNDYAMSHLDEKLMVGYFFIDEPDNAQTFKHYWNGDKMKIKEGWPEIYEKLGLDRNEYRGYGPSVPPKWVIRDYQEAVRKDPTRPVFLGMGVGVSDEKHFPGRGERTGRLDDYPEYIKGGDVIGYDIYPAAAAEGAVKDALWYVAQGIRRLREWSKDTKPVFMSLETCAIMVPGSKPTPAQTRSEVWMAIIHGARFINYFVHQFKPKMNTHALLDDPEMLAAVTSVNGQIKKLAPVLNSPTIDGAVTIVSTNAHTPVHAIVKRRGGATYVFSVAMHEEPTEATFTVSGLGDGKVDVLDENRTLPMKAGVFRDTFGANGVHLYKIQ